MKNERGLTVKKKIGSNVFPLDHLKAVERLTKRTLELENDREPLTAILRSGRGSPGFDSVLGELDNTLYELRQMVMALRG